MGAHLTAAAAEIKPPGAASGVNALRTCSYFKNLWIVFESSVV
jgi:hypothetical protein